MMVSLFYFKIKICILSFRHNAVIAYLIDITHICTVAAAAKSLQSCPTLSNPIDGSSPGSPVLGILQAESTALSEALLVTEDWSLFIHSFMEHLRSIYFVPGLGSVTGLHK